MDEQKSSPQQFSLSLEDIKGFIEAYCRYIHAHRLLQSKYRKALEFAEDHIKSGKPWDEECEKVIGEALRPKSPKGFAEGPKKYCGSGAQGTGVGLTGGISASTLPDIPAATR